MLCIETIQELLSMKKINKNFQKYIRKTLSSNDLFSDYILSLETTRGPQGTVT